MSLRPFPTPLARAPDTAPSSMRPTSPIRTPTRRRASPRSTPSCPRSISPRPATSPQVGRSFQSGQRSQALIEFALVSPVLLLLLFGVIDLGRAIFYYDTINHAAREGARVAVRASNSLPTNTDVLNAVAGQM